MITIVWIKLGIISVRYERSFNIYRNYYFLESMKEINQNRQENNNKKSATATSSPTYKPFQIVQPPSVIARLCEHSA